MGRLFSLTYPTAAVLLALRSGHRYGFDIMDATGLPSGTVYPALRRLKQLGYVSSRWEAQAVAAEAKRPRRRYYEIGKQGRAALEQALQRFRVLNEPLPEAHGDEVTEPS